MMSLGIDANIQNTFEDFTEIELIAIADGYFDRHRFNPDIGSKSRAGISADS